MMLTKKMLFMLNDIKTYKSYDNINNDIDKNTLGMKKVIFFKSLSSSLMELEKVLKALSPTPLYNLPTGATIYKFYRKLVRLNIIKESYDYCIKKYLKIHKPKIFITDTTLIPNKNGISDIGYNPQLNKHLSTKISLIVDIYGIPLDIKIVAGNVNDSKIICNQFTDFNYYTPNMQNILIGDKGYDSNKIRGQLCENKFGTLIVPKNKRNTR